MRVLISEYLTGGPCLGSDVPSSMRREGLAMLRAVIADVAALPGYTVITTLEADLPAPPDCDVIRVAAAADEGETFQHLLSQVDAALIIAPETNGILAARCRQVRESGVTCWNCSNDAITSCGDKLGLAQYLRERGLPTIETRLMNLADVPVDGDNSVPLRSGESGLSTQPPGWRFDAIPRFNGSAGASPSRSTKAIVPSDFDQPLVMKPRDGAGSNLTFLVRSRVEWDHAVAQFVEQGQSDKCVVQTYFEGRALSVGVNISFDRLQIDCLPVGEQRLSADGRFHYRGGVIPASLSIVHQQQIHGLVRSVCEAIPGLAGFIGLDLILTTEGNPVIVEINPRLTTSYVGYRQLYSAPLPLRWIDAQARVPASSLAGCVEFSVDHDAE